MAKTIFVLLDGCSDRIATRHLGYLEHLAIKGEMARYTINGELPSSSRPIYETLLTGLPVAKHGVSSNLVCRKSEYENLFSLCKENGLSTAAAAYYWVSELYNSAPFVHGQHRIQQNTESAIENGIFYFEDTYPDSHVLFDAEHLRAKFKPDFLMVHTMNLDDVGHKFGEGSREQAMCAMRLDTILAALLPIWINDGYEVIVTADHGMDSNGTHGGNHKSVCRLPMYVRSRITLPVIEREPVSQLAIAPLMCAMLGIRPSGDMINLMESGVALIV